MVSSVHWCPEERAIIVAHQERAEVAAPLVTCLGKNFKLENGNLNVAYQSLPSCDTAPSQMVFQLKSKLMASSLSPTQLSLNWTGWPAASLKPGMISVTSTASSLSSRHLL